MNNNYTGYTINTGGGSSGYSLTTSNTSMWEYITPPEPFPTSIFDSTNSEDLNLIQYVIQTAEVLEVNPVKVLLSHYEITDLPGYQVDKFTCLQAFLVRHGMLSQCESLIFLNYLIKTILTSMQIPDPVL
jgi:hypothetical protein